MSFWLVARKEFADQISGRRFLVITALLMLLVGYAAYTGMQRLQLEHRGGVLLVYTVAGGLFTLLGAVMGLLAGFDLITKEREMGTLRVLLSHPVHRDEVIAGKVAGAFSAIALATGGVLSVTTGLLLVYGMPLSYGELKGVLLLWAATVVYIFAYFSFGIFGSAVARTSGTALVIALLLTLVFSALIPAAGEIAGRRLAGEPPGPPVVTVRDVYAGKGEHPPEREYLREYERRRAAWEERKRRVSSVFMAFSPAASYMSLLGWLERGSGGSVGNILPGLAGIPAVFLTLTYLRFVREDVV